MSKFKVGDEVYVNWGDKNNIWRGIGKIVLVCSDSCNVFVNDRTGGFFYKNLVSLEIYYSPLYQALKECEEITNKD